jgi:hypothetical protein
MTGVRSRLVVIVASAVVVLLTACATLSSPRLLQQQADREWGPTLDRVRALTVQGHIARADSLLAQFAVAYPSAPQAVEANYWRAVVSLRWPAEGISLAIPLLQAYVAAGRSTEHWTEADALLRVASRVDTLSRVAATYVSRGEVLSDVAAAATAKAAETKAVNSADSKAQDEEIKRLKDELAKSKEELDRIKKRLAEPPKKPPVSQ